MLPSRGLRANHNDRDSGIFEIIVPNYFSDSFCRQRVINVITVDGQIDELILPFVPFLKLVFSPLIICVMIADEYFVLNHKIPQRADGNLLISSRYQKVNECQFTFKSDPFCRPIMAPPCGTEGQLERSRSRTSPQDEPSHSFLCRYHPWLPFHRCPMRRSFYNQRGANLDEISPLRGSLLHDVPHQ